MVISGESLGSTPSGSSRFAPFGPITVEYDDTVLEPRTWTLAQSAWAAEFASTARSGPILELYCGAGHIGLAAAKLCDRALVQVDDSAPACAWAARNAIRSSIDSDVRCASVDAALRNDERFSIVIADPPYLRSDEVAQYPADPMHAIDGGHDGLVEVERALRVIATHTTVDAAAFIQVRGPRQCEAITTLLSESGIPLRVADARTFTDERTIVLLQRLTNKGDLR